MALHKIEVRVKFTCEAELDAGDHDLVSAIVESNVAKALELLPIKIKGKAKIKTVRKYVAGKGKWDEIKLDNLPED